jgi:molecular chaperone DnaK (HSP70)
MAIQRLREAAEKAKIELSSSIQVPQVIPKTINRINNSIHIVCVFRLISIYLISPLERQDHSI